MIKHYHNHCARESQTPSRAGVSEIHRSQTAVCGKNVKGCLCCWHICNREDVMIRAPVGPWGWGESCPSKCLGVQTLGREGKVQEVGSTPKTQQQGER